MPATKTQRATRVSVEIGGVPYYLKVLSGNVEAKSADLNDTTSTEDGGFATFTGGCYMISGNLRCIFDHGGAMLSTKALYENQFVTNLKVFLEGAPSGTVCWTMGSALIHVVSFEINPKSFHQLEFQFNGTGTYTRPSGDTTV